MAQKPKIQYVGQFYVIGSEAHAVALKEKQKKAKTKLPQVMPEQTRQIRVEPVALVSILLAVVLVSAMVSGCLGLHADWESYQAMDRYVDSLSQENAALTARFREGYDLDEIELRARSLGMVPADQVQHRTVEITMPQPQEEETLLDEIVWFLRGLFA